MCHITEAPAPVGGGGGGGSGTPGASRAVRFSRARLLSGTVMMGPSLWKRSPEPGAREVQK